MGVKGGGGKGGVDVGEGTCVCVCVCVCTPMGVDILFPRSHVSRLQSIPQWWLVKQLTTS